jgi:predicted permease
LADETLDQLSQLVIKILLPFYMFYTTATSATLDSLSIAPILVAAGVAMTLCNYLLAAAAIQPSGVAERQRSAFRFSIVLANTVFIGFPLCHALFGPMGVVYAVLFDFGGTLVVLTLGIWDLSGGRLENWRTLVLNPLIWGVGAGLVWVLGGWALPEWLAAPFQALGDTTLPLALLVGGAQTGNVRSETGVWRRQILGLSITRLILSPVIIGCFWALIGWDSMQASVAILQTAVPVGVTAAIMAQAYGADAKFAASATLWSTLASIVTLPVTTLLVLYWFQP